MTDITLKTIASGYNLNKINDNFVTLEDNINNTSIQSTGGNNVMSQDFDMNSKRMINLPAPVSGSEPIRLSDAEALASQTTGGSTISETPPIINTPGDRWTRCSDMKAFLWYVDVDGGQWIEDRPSYGIDTIQNLTLPYEFESAEIMMASTLSLPVKKKITTGEWYTGSGKGGAEYIKFPIPTVADGFGDLALSDGTVAVLQHKGVVSASQLSVKYGVANDDTLALQGALRYAGGGVAKVVFNGIVYVDGSSILSGNVAKEGVQVPSGSELEFLPSAGITQIPTTSQYYNILTIYNVEDVTIRGGTIRGDRDEHLNPQPPNTYGGIGVRIQGATNVFLYDLLATKTITDGIAVVYDDQVSPIVNCENIHFKNCSGTFNIRNGISIIGCVGGSIVGGNWSGNSGVAPEAGVLLEPNVNVTTGVPISVVSDFVVSDLTANDNGYSGVALEGTRGIVERVTATGITATRNRVGILALYLREGNTVSGNTASGNTEAGFVTVGCPQTVLDANSVDVLMPSAKSALYRSETPQGLELAAHGALTGIKVPDNSNVNFGTDDFTIATMVSKPDWFISGSQTMLMKVAPSGGGQVGWSLEAAAFFDGVGIHSVSAIDFIMYRDNAGETYRFLDALVGFKNEPTSIIISVVRESTGVDGSITLILDGMVREVKVIPAAAVVTLTNTGDLSLGARNGSPLVGQFAHTFYNCHLFNRALENTASNPDAINLITNGISTADQWGVSGGDTGCLLALTQKGIQPSPGLWLDSSPNKNHARQPPSSCLMIRPDKTFEIRWSNTYSAATGLQYIGGVNSPIFPVGNIRIDSFNSIITGSPSGNLQYGDGSNAGRYVPLQAFVTGFNEWDVSNRNTDLTNRDLTVNLTTSFTGTVETIVKGTIL